MYINMMRQDKYIYIDIDRKGMICNATHYKELFHFYLACLSRMPISIFMWILSFPSYLSLHLSIYLYEQMHIQILFADIILSVYVFKSVFETFLYLCMSYRLFADIILSVFVFKSVSETVCRHFLSVNVFKSFLETVSRHFSVCICI